MPSPYDDISLLPYGGTTGYLQPAGGGGLLGGGQQPNYGGLLGAAGGGDLDTDKLMNMLIRRQLEQSMQPNWGAFTAALGKAAQPSLLPKSIGAALAEASGALSSNEGGDLKGLQALKLASDIKNAQQLAKLRSMTPGQMADFMKELAAWNRGGQSGPPPTPGVPGSPSPSGATVPAKPLIPRVTGTDETTGDLGGSYADAPPAEDAGRDSDWAAGGGIPPVQRPQAAVGLTGSAWELANNNFGGLRKPGVVAGPSQGGFQSFATPEQGVAAISRQLDRYASGATTGTPLTTVRQIVSTWAPPNENPTEVLIARASRIVGVDPDAPLDVSNPQVKAKLIEATIANEQGGRVPVPRDLISRVAASNAPMASGGQMPPPRIPADSWLNQPVSGSGFRTPSDAPGNQAAAEWLRQSVLGMLAGGSPLVNPDQSPTGALPPQDEVLPSGPRPAIPGLLKAQYTGQVNPDQSPSLQMGGQPMSAPVPGVLQPAAPAGRPPMAPPSYVPQNIPQPDTAATEALLARLAAMRALTEAQGLGDPFKPLQDMILNSPRYQREKIQTEKGAAIPYQYLEPQHNIDLQTQMEIMKQQAAALGKWLSPEANVQLQTALKEAQAAAEAGQRSTKISIGGNDYEVTLKEAGDYAQGKGVPRLGIQPDSGKAAGGAAPGAASDAPRGGAPSYTEAEKGIQKYFAENFGKQHTAALDAASSISQIHDARRLIDRGIFAGKTGPLDLEVARIGSALGVTGKDTNEKIANTQTFLIGRSRDTLNLIRALGANPSNTDRIFAEKIAGGDISLDPKTLRDVLDTQERLNRVVIQRFNELAGGVNPRATGGRPLTVEAPSMYRLTGTGKDGSKWYTDETGKWVQEK